MTTLSMLFVCGSVEQFQVDSDWTNALPNVPSQSTLKAIMPLPVSEADVPSTGVTMSWIVSIKSIGFHCRKELMLQFEDKHRPDIAIYNFRDTKTTSRHGDHPLISSTTYHFKL